MMKDFNQVINAGYEKNYLSQNKVRDHDNVTGKYRGSAHCRCNINLKLTQKSSCTIS